MNTQKIRLCFTVLIFTLPLGFFSFRSNTSTQTSQAAQIDEESKNSSLRVIESSSQGLLLELTALAPQINPAAPGNPACEIVTVPGLEQLESPGLPALPVQGAMVGLPPDARPSVVITAAEWDSLPGSHDLCPALQPVLSPATRAPWRLSGYSQERGSAYQQNAFIPAAAAEMLSTGNLRSQRFAQIRFNPVRYNPVSGEVRYYSRIRIEIHFNSDWLNSSGNPAKLEDFTSQVDEGYFEESLSRVLINYEQARLLRSRPAPDAQANLQSAILSSPAYKIEVNQDGIYQVDYADLLAAGIPAASLDSLDPRTFQLFNQSVEAALYVEGQADGVFDSTEYLLFYGKKLDTEYSETNVYWLNWGDTTGLRMLPLNSPPSGSGSIPLSFLTTQHAELDTDYYSSEPSGVDNDHWFWGLVYAASGPASLDFTTELRLASTGSPTITMRGLLKGYSGIPYHHTRIYLNGNLIDDHSFAAGSDYSFVIPGVPQAYLLDGTNTLKVECPHDGSITLDSVLVNWFEIDYDKAYLAESDRLFFDGDQAGKWEFQVDGFTDGILEAYDITNPLLPVPISGAEVETTASGYRLDFENTISGERHYLAQTYAARLDPLDITLDNPSSWKTNTTGADYIIISHADFLNAIQPLASHRSSQFRVQVVDVQDLYDEFNGGVFSPEAIWSFLDYAYANWVEPAPSFVLLVGDGNFDFKNIYGWNEPNYIPPYLDEVDPWVGETATDNHYASVSGDDILPDMYIGRFPVKTAAEAQIMANKTINYELSPPPGSWNSDLTFLADAGGNFANYSNQIIDDLVPPAYSVEKIYSGVTHTPATARAALLAAINQGTLIVNYKGHGDILGWGYPYYLSASDVPNFINSNMLPFILPMTCLEGYFAWPKPPGEDYSGLGESIVRIGGRGAIASWSPTGFGLVNGHHLLNQSLMQDLFLHNQTQLGPLTTQAKYNLFANGLLYSDLIETYVLFGDPALKLQTLTAPVAPSNLLATTISHTQIDLNWSDNSDDETGFRVERSLDNSAWSLIATANPGATGYPDNGLTSDTTYYYRVRAINNNGGSTASNTDSATTLTPPPPDAPTSLEATAVSHTQIDLVWADNSSDETGFSVERSLDNSSWSEIALAGIDVAYFSDTGLPPNTLYYYRVRATNDYGSSAYSNTDSATTFTPPPPAAPTNLSATAVLQTQIDLTWSDNSGDESEFQIERSPDGITGWQLLANVAPDITNFSHVGLTCEATHYYRVRAYRAGDAELSDYSNTASATTLGCIQIFLPLVVGPEGPQ